MNSVPDRGDARRARVPRHRAARAMCPLGGARTMRRHSVRSCAAARHVHDCASRRRTTSWTERAMVPDQAGIRARGTRRRLPGARRPTLAARAPEGERSSRRLGQRARPERRPAALVRSRAGAMARLRRPLPTGAAHPGGARGARPAGAACGRRPGDPRIRGTRRGPQRRRRPSRRDHAPAASPCETDEPNSPAHDPRRVEKRSPAGHAEVESGRAARDECRRRAGSFCVRRPSHPRCREANADATLADGQAKTDLIGAERTRHLSRVVVPSGQTAATERAVDRDKSWSEKPSKSEIGFVRRRLRLSPALTDHAIGAGMSLTSAEGPCLREVRMIPVVRVARIGNGRRPSTTAVRAALSHRPLGTERPAERGNPEIVHEGSPSGWRARDAGITFSRHLRLNAGDAMRATAPRGRAPIPPNRARTSTRMPRTTPP